MSIWRGAVAIIDEVDIVLHPLKSELNWPLGDRHALNFAPVRWELPWYLISAILRIQEDTPSPPPSSADRTYSEKELALLARLRKVVSAGQEQKLLQMVPHLVLLDDAFYHQHIKPVLADWLLLYLRRQRLRDITDEQVPGRDTLACVAFHQSQRISRLPVSFL